MVFHGDSWVFCDKFIGAALQNYVRILFFWKNCKLGVPIDLYWFELGHSCEFLLGQSCCWGWVGEVCIGNVTGICWINGKGPGHGPAVSESQFGFQWEKGYFFTWHRVPTRWETLSG